MINNDVIGKIKDKSEGKIIIEFVGLKSKMYSLIDVLIIILLNLGKSKLIIIFFNLASQD